ncbi:hypothetical protein AB0L06_25575 [Spirillospora sp. NPDC052269]
MEDKSRPSPVGEHVTGTQELVRARLQSLRAETAQLRSRLDVVLEEIGDLQRTDACLERLLARAADDAVVPPASCTCAHTGPADAQTANPGSGMDTDDRIAEVEARASALSRNGRSATTGPTRNDASSSNSSSMSRPPSPGHGPAPASSSAPAVSDTGTGRRSGGRAKVRAARAPGKGSVKGSRCAEIEQLMRQRPDLTSWRPRLVADLLGVSNVKSVRSLMQYMHRRGRLAKNPDASYWIEGDARPPHATEAPSPQTGERGLLVLLSDSDTTDAADTATSADSTTEAAARETGNVAFGDFGGGRFVSRPVDGPVGEGEVLEFLKVGAHRRWRPQEIAAGFGMVDSEPVRQLLQGLAAAGRARKHGSGRYQHHPDASPDHPATSSALDTRMRAGAGSSSGRAR